MASRSRMGLWALGLLALAGVAAFALTSATDDDSPHSSATTSASSGSDQAIRARPSAFARREIPPLELELYQQTGEQLGLDWSVIAAVDRLETAAEEAGAADRISAIAYELQARGAPYDYRKALESYEGLSDFAPSVLRLADRYRELADDVPPARAPLELPTVGPIIAGFGQQYGVLHDGIDIDAPSEQPVRAAAAGLVISTGFHQIFGEYTCVLHRFPGEIRGERELTTCYGNQSRYEVQPGDGVEANEVIGRVGCTGTCLRPHVHFQVRLGAGAAAPVTDPAPFLGQAGAEVGDAPPLEAQRP